MANAQLNAADFLKDIPDNPNTGSKKLSGMSAESFLNDNPAPTQTPKESFMQKVKNAAYYPMNQAESGLKQVQNLIRTGGDPNTEAPTNESYTGNLPRDIAVNAPRILGESGVEALSKVAPSFVHPLALAGAAASEAAPYLAPAGNWIAKTLEGTSGISNKAPGALTQATQDAGKIIGPGVEKAREMYQAAKDGEGISPMLAKIGNKEKFVETALEMAKDGTLNPEDALAARKEVQSMKGSLTQSYFDNARSTFDEIAKKQFAGADAAYKNAVTSEALRSLAPINKNGTPAQLRIAEMLWKPFVAPVFSPLAQGLIATLGGMGARAATNPIAAPAIEGARAIGPAIKNDYTSLRDLIQGRKQ